MSEPFIGEIKLFAPAVVPRGWLPCNGALVPIVNNQALYSLLGIMYGGDGVSTFGLPDLRGRAPLGVSPAYPQGQPGGEAAHALTAAELPSHTHQVMAASTAADKGGIEGNYWAGTTSWSDSADTTMAPAAITQSGGSQPHNNMQPFLALNYYIAMVGIYPSRP